MQIIIEDKTIEWELKQPDWILLQIIEDVEAFLLTINRVAIGLSVNGQALTQEELEIRQQQSIEGIECLQFETMGLSKFIQNNLNGVEEANKKLIEEINAFATELYSMLKSVDPQTVIEDIRDFYFFWLRLYQIMPAIFEDIDFGGKNFPETCKQLQNIFKEIVEAMEEEDCVLAADLLQYEIIPVIEDVGKAIPAIINQANEFLSGIEEKKLSELLKEQRKQV
jgi:hypothetical protein